MLLNADILFDNLPAELRATMAGPKSLEPALHRPELYEGGESPFRAGHLYLVSSDRIPQRALAERGSVIVSIGDNLRLERYRMRCSVIMVAKEADFFSTFNTLQRVFDLYDSWEEDLRRILEENADISRMLNASEAVFGNPLFAIDSSFRMLGTSHLAESRAQAEDIAREEDGSLSLEAIGQFLGVQDLHLEEREPLVLSLLDQTTLNFNLFVEDEYRGCVTVQYVGRTYRPSDKPLIAVLGKYLVSAIKQLTASSPEGLGSLRQAIQDLVEARPLDNVGRGVIEAANDGRRYLCLRMKVASGADSVPLGFVRNALEGAFRNSVVFEYHRNSVVAVFDADALLADASPARAGTERAEERLKTAVAKNLAPFTGAMEMRAGFSNPFANLAKVRELFLQADRALDLGMLFAPEEGCYAYEDFALHSMILGATGEMDLDLLFPEGLRRLVDHDATSATSYVETLRTYLENNAGVAKTAADLYVHRSTLMERLTRIRRELGLDLADPDVQLRLRILLRASRMATELKGVQK